METLVLSASNIAFIIGIFGVLGVIFTVYNYFKDPQIKGDKRDALLAQQVQWQNEGNERRFKEIQDNFQGMLLQSNNHIHTVEVKVDSLATSVNCMGNEVTKLSTIIEERIPKN